MDHPQVVAARNTVTTEKVERAMGPRRVPMGNTHPVPGPQGKTKERMARA